MIRVLVENVFFFLLPTLLYVTWYAFSENTWPSLWNVLRNAPLAKLFVTGATLMLATLILFSSISDSNTGDVYVPPHLDGGELKPGHTAIPGEKP